MTIGASGNVSPGFGRYIQADIYNRMNRDLPKTETITDNMIGCTNEGLSLAVKNFIQAPDKVGCIYGLIHTQSQSALPETLRNANTTVEDRELFKSVLGMLSTKENNFTSSEKALYQKLCDRFCSEIKKEDQEFKTDISQKKHVKNITNDDKQFWVEAAPLLETYSKDIVEDLTAHMLNQSINAWCEYHNINDRDWARSNIEQIFDSTIRMYFNVLDYEIMEVTKEAKSAIQDRSHIRGAIIRFGYMKMFDAVASIPLSLRRQTPAGVAKPRTTEKAVGTSDLTDNVNGHHSPKASSSPGNITVYGSNATATSYGGNTPTTPSEPWSSMTEKLLTSDKLNQDQCFILLKDLIASMGERRETPANFFNRYPLLSRLNGISMQDLSSHSTRQNGNSTTATEPLFIETDSAQPSAPVAEPQQEPRVQLRRRASATSSVSSDVSSMSPARSPLDDFQISALSPRQNVNPLASIEAYRTVGTDLSAVVTEKGPAANDDSSAIEEASRSGAASSVGSSSSAINSEDLALLKRWLGDEVQENEKEIINKLILRGDGLYTQTLDHFLERAFLAEAGTEERSDIQKAYINESFRKMQLHEDFFQLSRSAQALVEKYSEKRNSRVLTTTPGVRRTLSSQISLNNCSE